MVVLLLSNRLKELRIERELLQKDIAQELNITSSAYGFYEQGKRTPDADTLNKLSEYFNVSLDYLMGKSDIRNPYKIEKYPDVTDVEEAIKIIMEQPGLMLNGELLTDDDKIILANSIQMGLRIAAEMRAKNKDKK